MTDLWRTVEVVSSNVEPWSYGPHKVPYCEFCGRFPISAASSKYCESCITLVVLLQPLGPWVENAKCDPCDPDFFPVVGTDLKGAASRAKKVCASCPVQDQCLETALKNREVHGIWGGKSRVEREKIRRERGMIRK